MEQIHFIEIAARQGLPIPKALRNRLSNLHSVEELQAFLNDVAEAEASIEILIDTELQDAARRRLSRLGFGPEEYDVSKLVMLGILFSTEVGSQLERSVQGLDDAVRQLAA